MTPKTTINAIKWFKQSKTASFMFNDANIITRQAEQEKVPTKV